MLESEILTLLLQETKTNLDKSIENLDNYDLPQFTTGTNHVSAPVSRNDKVRVAIPKAEGIKQFYDSLSECKNKPVCLSLVQPHSESFISKTRGIKPITDLFYENYLQMNHADLLKECQNIQLRISDAKFQLIERETLNQARESSFYQHRAGRIGASQSKAASHTDPCILPEILGRWHTRKLDPTIKSSLDPNGECYRQKKTIDLTATCSNPGCPISKFHLSCLAIQKVPKFWYCPHCRKLP